MRNAKLEKLIAEINFNPPAPLSEEERTALQQFEHCHTALRQVEDEKRVVQSQRRRDKRQGLSSIGGMTTRERALFDHRIKQIKADLKSVAAQYSEEDLKKRSDFEVSQTLWTLIESFGGHEDWLAVHYTSKDSLEYSLFNMFHAGYSIEEVA